MPTNTRPWPCFKHFEFTERTVARIYRREPDERGVGEILGGPSYSTFDE
jgi:hypothetical protein